MKVFKRDAVIVTVLLFVCVAVYLNWSYNRKEHAAAGKTAAEDAASTSQTEEPADESAGLFYMQETKPADEIQTQDTAEAQIREYFAGVRLSRQQARDEATETLQVACGTEGASAELIDEAVAKMTKIADWTVLESELENLIMAHGFSDCVVYILDDSVSVTVPAPDGGLSSALVAQITDVITGETEYPASALKIMEIR